MNASSATFPTPEQRVIFQPEFVEFGGEERVILALSEGLHAQGKPHCVLCYHDRIDLARHAQLPLEVFQLQPPSSPAARVKALGTAIDRLTAQGSPVPVLFNIQSAYHAGLAGARRYHLRIPDTYSLLSPPRPMGLLDRRRLSLLLQHWGTRRGIRRADSLLTNTQALSDEMWQLYGRKSQVVYLGGQGQMASARPTRPAQPVELLSVSRLQASKRIDWILRALAALPSDARLPDWRLHVVGKGPEHEALMALKDTLGLGERVVFHGFVTDEQLDALYERAHAFLMPARQGYGLPAIEALYRHCAVVMNTESGVAEILCNTPWVTVAAPGEEAYRAALHAALPRLAQPDFFDQPLPSVPTMEDWARELIEALQW